MKTLNIFRPGTHTAASGATLSFTEDVVRAMVESYDPSIHEAPIVVGHPKDNGPAYGWVQGLSYNEETGVEATPHQVDADFNDLVQAGRFKKISASFYTPDAPNNPVPGNYYLRHVGFLGAQPPAVKGLRDAAFNDSEEGVVEFGAIDTYETGLLARVLQNLREFLIGEFNAETADRVVPSYAVEDIQAAARTEDPTGGNPSPSFSEDGDPAMNEEELKAAQAKLEADQAEFAEKQKAAADKEASFAEREQAIADKEKAARQSANKDRIQALVVAGKVLPAQTERLLAFMDSISDVAIVEFGEGDDAVKEPAIDSLFAYLDAQPKVVDYAERAAADEGEPIDKSDANALAQKAQAYVTEQAGKGNHVSYAEAMTHITANTDAE